MAPTTTRIESYTLANRSDLCVLDCATCGLVFAIPTAMEQRRRNDGKPFYCPNGHVCMWSETEAMRERKKAELLDRALVAERARRDRAEAEAAHQAAVAHGYKGAMVQTKKRAAKGVCPVAGCRRHFVDVQRHVASKHPDFTGDPA